MWPQTDTKHVSVLNKMHGEVRMASRKEFGSLSSGIIGSFASRNNDIEGYWAIGKLLSYCQSSSENALHIDLIRRSSSGAIPECEDIAIVYADMLNWLLKKRQIPAEWVVAATITIDFVPLDHPTVFLPMNNSSYSCRLICDIVDDNGHHHVAHRNVCCMPHDPMKEQRSSRCNQEMLRCIATYIEAETGYSAQKISRQTRLYHDVGIDGEDAVMFLEKFAEQFEVDMSAIAFYRYFHAEGLDSLALLKSLVGLGPKARLEALTVEMLEVSALSHQWQY
ncbi:hypothetical protein JCM19237_1982 [Photobacterium aphoticum]|uniref:Uncharacterized protein n=1 Tax=Photobacterium aphoticum TaxID=754436 RepID=A0A090RFJ1_9GAMM|nr:hypothetical protein JCM19237_1982 [Photobacterium aphoticum]